MGYKGSQAKMGENNPAYTYGLSRKNYKYKCPICRRLKMTKGYSKSCRDCYFKILKGKGNPNYDNHYAKKYYCIDCKKIINSNYKRCQSCACKYIWKTSLKMKNRNFKGKNNPNYIHGKSNEPYSLEFNTELKGIIRKRDNYTCQRCGMKEKEHLLILGTVLNIHHIDYDKQNCKENNLITVCHWCNIRANYNRKIWKIYYEEKIKCPNIDQQDV